MALLDDITKVSDAVQKLTQDGLPIKLEHEIDNSTIVNFSLGLAAVALLLVLLLGVKDIVVKNITG